MNDLDLPKLIRESLDQKQYQEEHWEGTFQQYLDLVQDNPLVVRTALGYSSRRTMSEMEARLDLNDLIWREHRREMDQQARALARAEARRRG